MDTTFRQGAAWAGTIACLVLVACDADTAGGAMAPGGAAFGTDTIATDASSPAFDGAAKGKDAAAADTAGYAAQDTEAAADLAADAAPGAVPAAPDQARAWRKQVDLTPLASVSVGGSAKLELVAMRVTVQVEGLRARTLVDHIFHNPYPQTTEGRFRYALPADATVSYYAMFGTDQAATQPVFFGKGDPLQGQDEAAIADTAPAEVAGSADPALWGALHEAKVVAQETATEVYEAETAQKVDPALVEEVAPNTFEAKVFPIAAKGYNRVLVAFEQTLPRIGDAYAYTFVVPKGEVGDIDFTLIAPVAGLLSTQSSGSLPTQVKQTSKHVLHRWQQQGTNLGGMLAVDLKPDGAAEADVLAGTDPETKKAFAYLRLHPAMPALQGKKAAASQAVFVLDTSASETGRFGVDVDLMLGILEKSSTIQSFRVLTYDVGARWLAPEWLPNTPAGRAKALDLLDGALLEGATNFSAALQALAQATTATDVEVDVMVLSDGVINLGESSAETLMAAWTAKAPFKARFFAYRLGIGGDNLALFQALTRKGGAVFNCLTAADTAACATAHEAPGMLVESVTIEPDGPGGAQVTDVLVAGRQATLFPGATLTVAARLLQPGPAVVHVQGTVPGLGPQDVAVPVVLQPVGQLAPRAWAEVAVAQLLEAHEAKFEGLALALAQHYGIANRLGSFLVLESQATWQKYDLGQETAKIGDVALGKLLDAAIAAQTKVWTTWQQLLAAVKSGNAKTKVLQVDGGKLLDMVAGQPADELELPKSLIEVPLVKKADVPAAYLAALAAQQPFVVLPYSDEAERRRDLGQVGAAVRALTTALELNPADAEIERLIGWRVRSWQQPELALPLFLDVLRKRPFEPQSYRDLAATLGTLRPGLTMWMYEAVLAGDWNAKFLAVKQVVAEEYALFIQALATEDPEHPLSAYLAQRKAVHQLPTPTGDLRVTLTWNTDNVDIDLWVTDPLGQKCYYSNKKLKSGGELLADMTQGFGPERFQATKAVPGTYHIQAHYFANNGNAIEATTYVTATVLTQAGTPAQTVQTYDLVLQKKGDVATVAQVAFK